MSTTSPNPSIAVPDVQPATAAHGLSAVPLLYMCDFPPSNLRGGSVLMSRLLGGYPQNHLVALVGSYFDKVSPREGRLPCKHLIFPASNETGRWGIGRIKSLIEWLLIPVLAICAVWAIKGNCSRVILTVAHGHFFLAAALASWATKVPFILMVHDDWVAEIMLHSLMLKYFCTPLFHTILRRAAHVYVVAPYMQEALLAKYGVVAEVQMPATEPGTNSTNSIRSAGQDDGCLRIVYAGTRTSATDDSLNMLLQLVKGNKLFYYGVKSWELHLYVMATPQEAKLAGWDHERIRFHGWVSQDELCRVLRMADILFLPFSFEESQKYATEQAFPSKTADYLKSGRPILILAPAYSSVYRYAQQFGFAELVDELNEEKLAVKIAHIWNSPEYRERLRMNSWTTLEANHNINKQRKTFREVIAQLAGLTSASVGVNVIGSA